MTKLNDVLALCPGSKRELHLSVLVAAMAVSRALSGSAYKTPASGAGGGGGEWERQAEGEGLDLELGHQGLELSPVRSLQLGNLHSQLSY